jgi:signal transduction histidine kinase
LLDGRIPAQELKGRVILVGATATGLGDNLVTPLAGSSGTMPGIEFVANVLDGLHAGLSPRPVDGWVRLLLSGVLLLVLMALLLITTPQAALWATTLVCVGTALVAVGALRLWGLWWPPAAPIAAMALAYPLWSWRRLEASLSAMTRETGRIAAMAQPGRAAAMAIDAGSFFDPVETRIAAITRAVDQIASALATDGNTPEAHQHREDMMRHLAHDLRSPLVSLRSLAASLPGDRRVENTALLNRIDACARRALDLSEQFLLMGRAEALDPAYFAEVDLVQILHQSADDLFEDARSTGSRVERHCVPDCALVRGDSRLLHRVLLNLGWNALRHGPRGGTVHLSLEETAEGYCLTVHDQGSGFAPEALAHLSQRYAQGTSTSTGHGLGLTLARLVVGKHQATLSAQHPVGGGFSVAFRLARQ